MSKEYLVRGAVLYCSLGSASSKFELSKGHGAYVTSPSLTTETDRRPGENILPFGTCSALKGTCVPSPAALWQSTKTDLKINGEKILTVESVLTCAEGGFIHA